MRREYDQTAVPCDTRPQKVERLRGDRMQSLRSKIEGSDNFPPGSDPQNNRSRQELAHRRVFDVLGACPWRHPTYPDRPSGGQSAPKRYAAAVSVDLGDRCIPNSDSPMDAFRAVQSVNPETSFAILSAHAFISVVWSWREIAFSSNASTSGDAGRSV